MSRPRQYGKTPARAALAAMIVVALGAALVTAAYDDSESQQGWQQQQQYENRQPGSGQSQGQDSWQQSQRSGSMQGRNQQLERQVANQLRQEGFGQEGQIMILATGNRVILLGLVPDQNQKQQAEQVVNQIPNVQQVDNRLQVRRGTGRQNDSQLQQTIQQHLRDQTDAGQNVHVQVRNGRVTLSGQVNDWQEMADVLQAAFAAGAQNVASQLTTSNQGQYGMGQTDRGSSSQYSQDQWRGQPYGDQSSYDQEGTASLDRRYGRSDTGGYGQTYGQNQGWQQTDQYGQSNPYGPSGQYGRDTGSMGQFGQQGQQFSQASQMQRRLESQLRNQVRGGESLTVLMAGNQAYLFGRVPDEQTKRQAEQVVRSASGINQIENRITVSEQGWQPRDDSAIENDIQGEMRWSPFVNADQVQVRVNNGVATLSGRVDNPNAAAAVIENAFEGGARSVQNQLQISGPMNARGRESQMDRGYYPPYGYTPGQDEQTPWQSRQQRDQMGYDQQRQSRMQQGQQWDQQHGMRSQQQWQQTQQFSASDMALAQRVALQLQQQLSTDKTIHVMDPRAIYIHVSQGTVMLHGSVQDDNQKRQVEQAVRSVRGVQNVRNELKIGGQGGEYQVFGYVPGQSDQNQSQYRSQQDQTSGMQDRSQSGSQQGQFGSQSQSGQDSSSSSQTSGQSSSQQSQSGQSSGSSSQMGGQSSSQQSQSGQDSSSSSQMSGQSSSQPDQFGSTSNQSQSSSSQSQSSGQTGSQSQSAQGASQQMTASDRQIAQQIEQKLQQQLSGANINVTVSQGTATLQGSVQQDQQKQQAEQIARSTSGIRNIRDEITVGGQGEYQVFGYVPGEQSGQQPSSRSDLTLAHQIALQLQQQLGDQSIHVMDPQAIYVMVTNGTVMLHGTAQDNGQKQQAEQIVQSIRGVQDVRNELQIQGQPFGQQQQQYGQQQQMGQRQQMGQPQMGQQQMTASDRRLAQQVEQQLQQQLPEANITAHVRQGTVTLQGSVQDQSQKQQAERVARSVQGVQNVRNSLAVGGQGTEYPALGYVPGQEGQMQQGQTQQDTGISGDTQCVQMLKQSLTGQNLQSMAQNVYVTCHQGKMALYGYVKSDQEKSQLEKLTKQIPGIKEVDNNLIVHKEGWEQKSDADLREDVESQLWWSPYVDSDKINVNVQNGTVTLSGQADDWDAMRAAVKNAFDAGARRVKSQIQYPQSGGQSGSQSTTSRSSRTGSTRSRQSDSY